MVTITTEHIRRFLVCLTPEEIRVLVGFIARRNPEGLVELDRALGRLERSMTQRG